MNDSKSARFARRVFAVAGIYGLAVLLPMLFLEKRLSEYYPPAITHPEYFYGFLGVALAWQVLFLVISKDPIRYRGAMIPAILEKIAYATACLVLFFQDRLAVQTLMVSMGDLVWAVLFCLSFFRTSAKSS